MIDAFLKVAYDTTLKQAEDRAVVARLRKLPMDTLYKLATGETSLPKIAHDGLEWLEEFKDTPLFEKAIGLEQQKIQLEMMRQQLHAPDQMKEEESRKICEMEDQLRMQKKMLGLELATMQLQAQGGGAAPPAAMAAPAMPPPAAPPGPSAGVPEQGAGAMGDAGPPKMASEEKKPGLAHRAGNWVGRHHDTLLGGATAISGAVEGGRLGHWHGGPTGAAIGAAAGGLGGYYGGRTLGRMAQGAAHGMAHSQEKEASEELVDSAIDLGRRLAHTDMAKAAQLTAGAEVGQILAKTALDMNMLKSLGQGASGFLSKNRGAAIGAGVGAMSGLAHGLQKDEQGNRHLLQGVAEGAVGGLGGAALGHGAEHFTQAMGHRGATPGEALQAAGRQVKYQAGQALGAVKGAVGAPALPPRTGATLSGLGTAPTTQAPAMRDTGALAAQHMQQLGFARPQG